MSRTAAYITELQKKQATGVAIEHAYRPALQYYLEGLLPNIQAINDPKRQKCGAPDYIVRKGEIDVGYIEAKDINVGLDKTEKSDQMKRYLESLDNLILTDYLEFRFYRDGKKVDTVRIGELGAWFQTDAPTIKPLPENFEKLETLLADFIGFQGQTIKSPKQLAEMMARKAKMMRDVFAQALQQEGDDHTLREQWEAFKKILIHDMTAEQFADVYAQTIAYGLLTARYHDPSLPTFSREEARGLIPRSNPFVRQLFDYVCGANLDDRVVWIVDALCEVYRAADVNAILHKFGKSTGRNDPIVHFYEDFLGQYDKSLRKARGVWYTPEPVVNFIVRAVDEVLKTHFNLPEGLADTSKVTIEVDDHHITKKGAAKRKESVHRVQLLDVAAGTGTFTAEAIKQIYSRFAGQEGMWSSYVEEHLLPRLHGFEILMASYAMCHLKIDMLLQEMGYKPKNPSTPPRLGVYLTNALEEHHPDVGTLFAGWLAREANEASRIKKDMPIMVAYGNPPYSGHSANKGVWVEGLLDAYKQEPSGGRLQERNPKWLNDDYVKFLRLAEHYIEKNGHGVLAYITPHGYLDNPTFRGMRWHLLNTFDDIYVIDLHGNANKKEVAPDGSADKNVFDIMQGVAITIAVKHNNKKESLAQVHHTELWGERKTKYDMLWEKTLQHTGFRTLEPNAPNYLFIPFNDDLAKTYAKGFSITELMSVNSMGIVTSRDDFVIDTDMQVLQKRIGDFITITSPEEAKKVFRLKENQSFKVDKVKQKAVFKAECFVPITYRPFDKRSLYYDDLFIERSRRETMRHFVQKGNLGLVARRQFPNEPTYFFLSDVIIADGLIRSDNKGGESIFPLYLYPDTSVAQTDLVAATLAKRKPNLDDKIVAAIAKKLKLPFVPDHEEKKAGDKTCFSPLDLLDYIYAVLHSPSYRNTYKEFLKIDFPRIPYPDDAATFWQLVALGGELRALHLLEQPVLAKPITTYPIGGDNMVEKPTYAEGKVHINKEQYFGNVPEVAWNFYIGGYQPAQKWLKDRKGRTLSTDDLRHYQKIIIALTETDRLMKSIDSAWKPA